MPLDPEHLVVIPDVLDRILPGCDPLDSRQRLAAIEAVRRIIRRYSYSLEQEERLDKILSPLKGSSRVALLSYFPRPLPIYMSQAEIDACYQGRLPTLSDPADRAVMYWRKLAAEMTSMTGYTILRWLHDHPQGATPAEVDLLASLHDEFIYTNVQSAWADLLRVVAPDRAIEIAKTTPDPDVCATLIIGNPKRGRLFNERFPTYFEDEKRRERELLDSLDDDEWP
jgi:hypothetical protein